MARIKNLNESWNGHTHLEVESFIKNKLQALIAGNLVINSKDVDGEIKENSTVDFDVYDSIDEQHTVEFNVNIKEVREYTNNQYNTMNWLSAPDRTTLLNAISITKEVETDTDSFTTYRISCGLDGNYGFTAVAELEAKITLAGNKVIYKKPIPFFIIAIPIAGQKWTGVEAGFAPEVVSDDPLAEAVPAVVEKAVFDSHSGFRPASNTKEFSDLTNFDYSVSGGTYGTVAKNSSDNTKFEYTPTSMPAELEEDYWEDTFTYKAWWGTQTEASPCVNSEITVKVNYLSREEVVDEPPVEDDSNPVG